MFKILSYDVIDSTNDFLLKNHEKLKNLTVCWAIEQRRGRGRKGRYWHSPKGGLWFSILFKSRFYTEDPNVYTKIASISISLFLEKMKVEAHVKWPNDIYVMGKKMAGVLTESVLSSDRRITVVGVGMNVKNDIPEQLKDKAISLKDVLDDVPPVSKILNVILEKIWILYNKLGKRTGLAMINRMWKKRLYPKEGQTIKFVQGGIERVGKVINVHQDRLIVKTDSGTEELFDVELIFEKSQIT